MRKCLWRFCLVDQEGDSRQCERFLCMMVDFSPEDLLIGASRHSVLAFPGYLCIYIENCNICHKGTWKITINKKNGYLHENVSYLMYIKILFFSLIASYNMPP